MFAVTSFLLVVSVVGLFNLQGEEVNYIFYYSFIYVAKRKNKTL